ncbi:MAG TPA: RDD family protein [Bryobacteraceae bacterium]|nr:RDD family protein [Bryobacteraceae bacterium]
MTATRTRRPAPEQTQGRLDLDPPPARKTLSTTVEARIYCEYPVATSIHRAIAAALDWSLVLMGYGLFLLVYHLMGGTFALQNNMNIAMFAGMLGLIGLAYALLWTVVACDDTAGTRWAQLRITTFDGDRPDPRQRLWRLAGACLSLCTLVGLLWSLADEESLTWQDHISSTFPTPIPLSHSRRR